VLDTITSLILLMHATILKSDQLQADSVLQMTYRPTVSSGTLNSTIPYQSMPLLLYWA